ncbi:MAG: dephospho-CoA kinase [Pseudomonadota bacterium]
MDSMQGHELKAIGKKNPLLLLGVTGGIASGKTTVANMLRELGAPLIDFDILARRVVEPGQPAWKEIVGYFGEDILQKDGCLDRRKLSKIVFRDEEKRRSLERMIHPRAFEECAKEIKEIAERAPNAIIQVVIPLVIEVGLQGLFHKILVVYIPREKQIERLIRRDRIRKEEAQDRLRAQLPIEDKVRYADFVIYNDGALEETRRQVGELWETLKLLQKERMEKP